MSAANSAKSSKFTIPFLLLLILSGLVGNYFKFQIFFNIDFLFGSIFAMLALQIFGITPGILAAAVISSYTFILWNHPYAIIIMTIEVAVVGWLMMRRKTGMVLADTLFWLVIGLPLVFFFYHFLMEVPLDSTRIIMIKQLVNGITNALIARLIFTAFTFRSRPIMTSYREIIYNLMIFFVLFPTLLMLAIQSRTDYKQSDQQIRTMLNQASGHVVHRLNTWLNNRKSAIINLAEMAASRSPQQMQSYLELAKKSDVNFQRIGLHDKEATTIAYFPLTDQLGQSNIGKNFADRPFITTLKEKLQPMLSDVALSRIDKPVPRVALLAPVVIDGEYSGYVFGALGLHQLEEHLDRSTVENSMLYTLLDNDNNVIMTNRTDQTVMKTFARNSGTLTPIDKGLSQWVPAQPSGTPPTVRWGKSFYVAEAPIGSLSEWKLILEQPVAPVQKKLYDQYTDKLTILFLILLGALLLAEILSYKLVHSLEKLTALTYELPARLAEYGKEIFWPESSIKEANQLINNFREMAHKLDEKFNEINHLNESLEYRIAARTIELKKSRDEWERTFDSMPDMISVLDLNHHIIHANKSMITAVDPYIQGGRLDQPCFKVMHGLDAPPAWCPHALLMQDGAEHHRQIFDPQLNKHLFVSVTPVHNAEGDLVGSIHVARDISDRVCIEDELAALIQEIETRNRFVESVIKNLHSGIIVLGLDMRINLVNPYIAELAEIEEKHILNKNLADISPELHENIVAGKTEDELKVSFGIKQTIVGYNVADMINSAGQNVGYILALKDLTEIIKIRSELRQKERLSAMGEVVARVAHEMRNPLFGMTAAAQILEMELSLNETQKELMDSLLKESRRLNNLVEELLHTTRETRINKKRVNLLTVLDESLSAVIALLYEKGVSLRKDYSCEEIWLSADPEKLEQVILNLVKNALEATLTGGIITIMVETAENHVSVRVADKGEGIPPDILDRIFDVFYTTKKNGTGMGLSICRNIVEAHDGSLTAANNPAGGAEFVMQLPLGESKA